MATKLFLRNTTTNGITDSGDDIVYDMITTAGSAVDTSFNTGLGAGFTQVKWQQNQSTAEEVAWISGRVPAGGFTLTSTDISIWARESAMTVNAGGRYRVFRYQPGSPPTITELGGGPFDDGVEFGLSFAEMTWTGNVTDQAFSENDRILLRLYVTNIGSGGSGAADLEVNAADGVAGDSFFNIAETVTFKAEDTGFTATLSKTLGAATLSAAATVDVDATLSKTLAALVSAANATVDVDATLAKTLGAVTSSAAAEVTSPGDSSLARTLGALVASANASVDVDATLAKTLAALSGAGNATVDVDAQLARTLGALALSATADVAGSATASLNKTLDALVGSGVATVDVAATLNRTLANVTGAGAATVDISASVSKTLGTAALAAAAGVNVEAQLAKSLAALSLSANATLGELAAVAIPRSQPIQTLGRLNARM